MEAESRLGVDKMCKRQKELFCKKKKKLTYGSDYQKTTSWTV